MKTLFLPASFALLLMCLIGTAIAQPTLTVRPEAASNASVLVAGVFAPALMHGERFYYVSSSDLPLKYIKTRYSKKELLKLEAAGTKIVVEEKETRATVTIK